METMRKIKIVTDSACDIPKELEERYQIRILPFSIAVGDESYTERKDFTNEEFYQILATSPRLPTTSQYTPMQFLETYEEIWREGYTDVIYVSINSKGSATHGNSLMAKKEFFEAHPEAAEHFAIHVVDSRSYTIAYGYPVVEAAKKAEKGASPEEIVAYLEDWFSCCRIYFAPYSLEFVKKSGRVSCAAAFVGELMGLKPIISFVDGESKTVAKVRGDKAVIPAILKLAKERMIPHTPYCIIGGSVQEYIDEMDAESRKLFGYGSSMTATAGAAISINAGHRIIGIIIKEKLK